MRHFLLAATLCLGATSLHAQAIALVVGTEDYEETIDVRRADEIARTERALSDAGVRTVSAQNATLADLQSAISEFGQMAPQSDTLLVALGGRFVSTSTETYFLPSDADGAPLATLAANSLPLSTVLAYLAEAPGKAILVLATDDQDGEYGRYLRDGIGDIDPPNGVTVVTGDPRDAARFIENVLAEPGASIRNGADRYDLDIDGFLSSDFVFVEERRSGGGTAGSRSLRDRLSWTRAQQDDTAAAYRRYLEAWPDGEFRTEARDRLAELDRPAPTAAQIEAALNLNRAARRAIQRDLSLLDFDTRGIDGIFGGGTRGAIAAWQQAQNLPMTSYLDADQIRRLSEQARRRAAELEAEAERRRAQLQAQDEAFWDETGALGTEAGLRRYLERYPDGIYADRARADLAEITQNARDRASERERLAYRRATEDNTIASYQQYLDAYPQGAFAADARNRIDALRQQAQQAQNSAAARGEEALNLTPATRQIIEQRLASLGLQPGRIDGTFDENTRRALRRYQESRGLPPTGYVSQDTVVRILADSVQQIFD